MLPEHELLALIRERVDHPADPRELARTLGVPREARATFRRQLDSLVSSGALVRTRSGLYGLPDKMDLVSGTLSLHPAGYGFVTPDRPVEGVDGDLYVAGPDLYEAMHEDRVLVRVERRKAGGRAEARVLQVLERRASRVVGRLEVDRSGLQYVVAFDKRLLADVLVARGDERGASPGEWVSVEITRWPTPARPAVGRVIEVLGTLDTPGVDVAVILRKYAINDEHGEAALAEARRLGGTVRPRDLTGRTDFRDRIVVTIDGEHARDFDDAISIERRTNGCYWLGVHIADVAHYVAEGSGLDEEALERGTSVYFPERAVHMFPEALATGLCSLRPHVDRLVQSCLMEIDPQGTVRRFELHDGVICSAARLTYTEVNAMLTDRDPATIARHEPLVPTLELMHELFEVLIGRRRRRGSIDFDLPEPEVLLDAEGLVEAIIPAERNVAHRLIEEFMLVANETVAGFLDAQEAPALYRIHEPPDPVKVAEFDEFVSTLGYGLGAPPDAVEPRHFQHLVDRIKGTPEERPIAFLMLRTMQKARYDPVDVGHFGLAAKAYTHFTSPIRRYPDLVVHRALRTARHGTASSGDDEERAREMIDVARHTSDRERRADDAERELVQWKKVRFMVDKIGDEFDGYVTGVAPFGLFVELTAHFIEGLVHVSSMADDYYRYLERGHTLRGESTRKTYRLGDRVRVQVVRVDLERRQVDLGLVDILERVRRAAPVRGVHPKATKAAEMPRRRKGRPGRSERGTARRTRPERSRRRK